MLGPCTPPAERCNGEDDDCDGQVDEETCGIAGPVRALPWAGYWLDAIAGTATDDGFAFAYGSDAGRERFVPDDPVVLAWTDAAGEPRGDPVRLDDPREPGAAAITVLWTGSEVAVAWEASDWVVPAPTFVAFVDRGRRGYGPPIPCPSWWSRTARPRSWR